MADEVRSKGKHGGRRPGAGRKPKVLPATTLADEVVDLLIAEAHPDQIETAAQRHARTAITVLVRKLLKGRSESARVAAACEILDRGYGRPAVEIGGDAAMLPFVAVPALPSLSGEMRDESRKYANLAIEVLWRIAEFGNSETAVVAACKALLNRSLGTVGVAKMPDDFRAQPIGKKERLQRAAELAAVGRYATPKAPGTK